MASKKGIKEGFKKGVKDIADPLGTLVQKHGDRWNMPHSQVKKLLRLLLASIKSRLPKDKKGKQGGNIGNIDMKDFKPKDKKTGKKKTMMKRSSNKVKAGKGRYGDRKDGSYVGQR
tara:strand:+ start:222 stop:569 length:348 start_codon:yes stop_codon:yes gene_type:complete